MAENKLADMSTEFAIQILKLTDRINGYYSLSNQLRLYTQNAHIFHQHRKGEQSWIEHKRPKL